MDKETLAKFISGLNVVSYKYIDDPEDDHARINLVAQEVQAGVGKFYRNFLGGDAT